MNFLYSVCSCHASRIALLKRSRLKSRMARSLLTDCMSNRQISCPIAISRDRSLTFLARFSFSWLSRAFRMISFFYCVCYCSEVARLLVSIVHKSSGLVDRSSWIYRSWAFFLSSICRRQYAEFSSWVCRFEILSATSFSWYALI